MHTIFHSIWSKIVHLRSIYQEALKFPKSKERGPHEDAARQESGGGVHSLGCAPNSGQELNGFGPINTILCTFGPNELLLTPNEQQCKIRKRYTVNKYLQPASLFLDHSVYTWRRFAREVDLATQTSHGFSEGSSCPAHTHETSLIRALGGSEISLRYDTHT